MCLSFHSSSSFCLSFRNSSSFLILPAQDIKKLAVFKLVFIHDMPKEIVFDHERSTQEYRILSGTGNTRSQEQIHCFLSGKGILVRFESVGMIDKFDIVPKEISSIFEILFPRR
jgi:hypothetical protein